jgi:hypothetical protein
MRGAHHDRVTAPAHRASGDRNRRIAAGVIA